MSLRDELLTRITEEQTLRDKLEQDGTLADEYHAEREAMHIRHAKWLDNLITKEGLPSLENVGILGISAVCRIINDAISLPELQKKYLPMLQEKVDPGEYPKLDVALIEDCILFHEQLPQKYGLYFNWSEEGILVIPLAEDDAVVDERRSELGLIPIKEAREKLLASKELTPKNYAAKKAAYEAWRVRVGWVTS
ncbi:MAG TPA: DUF6624 domain-containing protein [Candidatus Kapabacteria bacterium]